MTVDVPLPVVGEELEARIMRAIRHHHRRHEEIVQAEFADMVSRTLLQMRPHPDAGERAAGITEGLEMAARTLLRLAGVPSTSEDHQEAPCDR